MGQREGGGVWTWPGKRWGFAGRPRGLGWRPLDAAFHNEIGGVDKWQRRLKIGGTSSKCEDGCLRQYFLFFIFYFLGFRSLEEEMKAFTL